MCARRGWAGFVYARAGVCLYMHLCVFFSQEYVHQEGEREAGGGGGGEREKNRERRTKRERKREKGREIKREK